MNAQNSVKKVGEPSQYHSKITEWPEAERPREKLLKYGAQALTDAELIAILIRSGTGKITAVDIAKTMLKDYDTIGRLVTRSVADIKKYKGIGNTKAVTLAAAFEIGRRAAISGAEKKYKITSPNDVANRFIPLMRDLRQEVFKTLLLDSSNNLLKEVEITRGTLNSSLVHPREVFNAAIIEPAAAIILLHNHPSGNPEPSSEDIQITRQLVEASKIIGIPIHDHIILAGNSFTSFAEKGIL
ncbi:MAG: DNA repair protein RadC [Bacteroidota bacterium]|nr:DNA repair protein RadC [Bacteroidota bacterium]